MSLTVNWHFGSVHWKTPRQFFSICLKSELRLSCVKTHIHPTNFNWTIVTNSSNSTLMAKSPSGYSPQSCLHLSSSFSYNIFSTLMALIFTFTKTILYFATIIGWTFISNWRLAWASALFSGCEQLFKNDAVFGIDADSDEDWSEFVLRFQVEKTHFQGENFATEFRDFYPWDLATAESGSVLSIFVWLRWTQLTN